ncbi:MAG: tyrosine-type recombinase/integrase [Dehalococcoidia bacterium]|nr:tyrosine-type recombinase/integrase [Dehalococcoidia bacterium]
MRYVLNHAVVLSRVPEGPLATHLASFAESLKQQGYAPPYVHRQVRLAAGFSRWLKERGIRLRRISADHRAQYLEWRHRRRRPHPGDQAALAQVIEFLRRERVMPAAKPAQLHLTPAEEWVQAYKQYLREDRGLAEATIINYAPFIDRFLTDRFGTGLVQLAQLEASDVVRFVQREARCLQLKRAKLLTTALRSFLLYARYRGAIHVDLAAAVPCVANWSQPAIPRGIAPEQIRRLLSHIDRGTPMGRRDYAILLLLARLGLRAGEVVRLELEDIDWADGSLRVHGKRGHRRHLPLPAEVGEALAAYLQDGRPGSASRQVFLRARAPVRGFLSQCAVGSIVRHALRRAGIDAPTSGAHQFRHGLATEMLRHGASLGQIGDLLGHQSPQTTTIYTKVDVDGLRSLALPWPGGGQ